MNTFHKYHRDLEHHQIELAYAPMRITEQAELKKLMTSIDSNGQVVAVIVIPAATSGHFILIDGYLRIQALKKLRQDIIRAEVWECDERDALLSLLANRGQRHWESIEEAQVIRELQTKHNLSQEQIAKSIGRSQTWVSHRLALLEELSESLMNSITKGKLSVWSAQRVLLPIARAIPEHADHLLKYLFNNKHPTRDLSDFLHHYQKSNKATREKMVLQPDLFFKSQKAMKTDKVAKRLQAGPEGQWQYRLHTIADQVKHLEKLIPSLFYENQEEKMLQRLRLPLEQIQDDLNRILITSRRQCYDRPDDAADHHYVTPVRQESTAH